MRVLLPDTSSSAFPTASLPKPVKSTAKGKGGGGGDGGKEGGKGRKMYFD
jgi:hypothetical protein